ncbi:MAG: hypothetical protein IKP52_02485 [Prevotella sp.]|nr:hypothetical protein [Prevotella sp.]MBR7049410.1 hypothetical protein [Prevotella sp.]
MKKILFFAAAAIAMLASCSQSDDLTAPTVQNQTENTPVSFDTYMGKVAQTRAYTKGPIDNSDGNQGLKSATFGVFAYLTTNNQDYNPASVNTAPSNQAPGFMYNQHITWNASSPAAWVYTPVKYWPNGLDAAATHQGTGTSSQTQIQKLSFFAYAPYTTATAAYSGNIPTALSATTDALQNDNTNGIKAITTNAFTGNVWVKYLMPKAQEDEAVDLLWGLRGSASYSETDNSASAGTVGTDYNINLTKQTVGEKVSFLFKHALTKIGGQTYETEDNTVAADGDKIGFKIVADVDGNNGDSQSPTYFPAGFNKAQTLITLKSIKIQDGKTASDDAETSVTGITSTGIYNSGWFNIETGTWDKQETTGDGATVNIVAKSAAANQSSTTDADYSINPEIREAASYSNYAGSGDKKLASGDAAWASGNPTGIYTTAVPVFAKETIPGVTLIPGGTSDIYVTVDYLVRTADPNLATGFSEVEQVITNKISLASLQSNKFYTIIIHLGMTSVKFEAIVADWQLKSDSTIGENGQETGGSTNNEQKIWLPSNVVE